MLKNPEDLKGLRGWLAFLGFSLVVSLIITVGESIKEFEELEKIMSDGTWELLSSSTSEYYNPTFVFLFLQEIIFLTCFSFAFLYIVYLYFSKHYLFPKYFIILFLIKLIYQFIQGLVVYYFLDQEFFDKEAQTNIYGSVLFYCIWSAYLIRSKRVELTFVEERPKKPDLASSDQ